MSEHPAEVTIFAKRHIHDCWNKIGVRGDSSCPELEKHVHCRNCPVYSAAASDLLDGVLPADHLSTWTRHVAQERLLEAANTHSVVVFRIGVEWLALPTSVFKEITSLRVVHTLPHRTNGAVLGLANVRGELLVCVSLAQLLGLEKAVKAKGERQRVLEERLLVIQREGSRVCCPVDEVYGIQRFHPQALKEVPATVARATATYTRAVLSWQKQAVGLLDDQLLFYTLNRSLTSATAT